MDVLGVKVPFPLVEEDLVYFVDTDRCIYEYKSSHQEPEQFLNIRHYFVLRMCFQNSQQACRHRYVVYCQAFPGAVPLAG